MIVSRTLDPEVVKSENSGHAEVGVRWIERLGSRALPTHRKPHPKAPGTARPDHGAA